MSPNRPPNEPPLHEQAARLNVTVRQQLQEDTSNLFDHIPPTDQKIVQLFENARIVVADTLPLVSPALTEEQLHSYQLYQSVLLLIPNLHFRKWHVGMYNALEHPPIRTISQIALVRYLPDSNKLQPRIVYAVEHERYEQPFRVVVAIAQNISGNTVDTTRPEDNLIEVIEEEGKPQLVRIPCPRRSNIYKQVKLICELCPGLIPDQQTFIEKLAQQGSYYTTTGELANQIKELLSHYVGYGTISAT